MGKKLSTNPTALTTSAANLLNGGGGDSAMRDRVQHIHVCNESASDVTLDLFVGATTGSAAGTALVKGKTIKANDIFDYYCDEPISSTQFLTGKASAGTSLTVVVEYEREVV